MRNIQRHIAVFFCMLLVLPLLSNIGLQLWQLQMQHEAMEKLESENLQTIIVVPGDLAWEKKDKEALIKGELFDVKSIHIQDGKYILSGLFDKQETALRKILVTSETFNFSIIRLLLLAQCFISIVFCISFNVKIQILPKRSTLFDEYPVQLYLAVPGHPPKQLAD